ncbi:MAG: zinc-dependent metalloprotease family protein [Rhodocyclaceae bacterium]|nr:zinc-dependent metalloprotease family protein [Rhodocyclaceae bacterium]
MNSVSSRQIGTVFTRLLLAVFTLILPAVASALPITKNLTVTVFDVCNNTGSNCASMGPAGDNFFAAETNKIWAQAGISITFNFVGYINSSAFSYINDNAYGTSAAALYNTTSAAIGLSAAQDYLFLVHTISAVGGGTTWGETASTALGNTANANFIAMDTVMSYSASGRMDTIAHELGHTLGLEHYDSSGNYLMASGGVRNIPSDISQISTNGLTGKDQLPVGQVAIARSDTLLRDYAAPEPEVLFLVLIGLAGAGGVGRRARPQA